MAATGVSAGVSDGRISAIAIRGASWASRRLTGTAWRAKRARKLVADGKGVETEAPLDEPFDIGVFTREPGKKGFDEASVLAFERRKVTSGAQLIRVVVDKEPAYAGIDPHNKRIDRNSDDNVKDVRG